LTGKYGPQILEELVDKKRSQVKWTRTDLESLIAEYRGKLEGLGP
jgi:hypothetical protein